ncbi:maspardin-like isoform X4 [Zingiber officinale]|uniref:maspardin-like isoform X4 n=1 Tax=Zingiber officinale TaxID=94328 RepID=UPI001C4DD89E|nr:maspardin-like isoform X4 [Zingiber officinale]
MKAGVSQAPGDYVYFKSQVPLHKISIGNKQWRYYDFGPKSVPPLICIPGIAGTADVYYKQIMSLSIKGYRVISVDIPRIWNHMEWVQSFEKFLDTLSIYHIHLYGTSLGGFLALVFAQHRPRRVKSLVLSNTFLETHKFAAAMPWSPIVNWTPAFLLKRYILSGIRDGSHEPFIADSIDFVVGQTNDYCAVPQQLKDQVSERFPGARRAILKTGGDFPFLSRPDEVNLYLQLHLRRVGVEAQLDNQPGTSKDDGADQSTDDNQGGNNFDSLPGQRNDGANDGAYQPKTSGQNGDNNGSDETKSSGPNTDNTSGSVLSSEDIGIMKEFMAFQLLVQASLFPVMLQHQMGVFSVSCKMLFNV